jgi:DNA-binding transcriptional MerR regulator
MTSPTPDSPDGLSIGELARRSGLSTHALRFYEQAGVLQPAGRAANGHRRYGVADLRWLAFVLRLKETGMPLSEIRQYAQWRAQGASTQAQRLALLQRHRERLAERLQVLACATQALDDKIAIYLRPPDGRP